MCVGRVSLRTEGGDGVCGRSDSGGEGAEEGSVRSMQGEWVVVEMRHVQLSCVVWHTKLAGASV